MQRAKAFLYVSLGILALAVAFHLGARSAQGQGLFVTAFLEGSVSPHLSGYQWAGDSAGGLWKADNSTSPWELVHQFPSPIAALAGQGVVLASGEVYWYRGGSGWEVINNIFAGGPVQSIETTWGRVKAERR